MYNKIYVGMQDLSVGLIDAINMMMVFCESSSLPVSWTLMTCLQPKVIRCIENIK